MEIDIRCTPHSQSAELQIVINGDFDLKQNEQDPRYNDFAYGRWYHNIYLTVTENSFEPNTGKQKTFYRSKLKTDGTSTIDTVFNMVIYPLHSETQYSIDFEIDLRDNNDNVEKFTKHLNFSTQQVQTVGAVNDRNVELTLKEKTKNAVYLYNKLVKTNKYALEAFCCLLGISDCAGNLNPAQYMIYKEFEVENDYNLNVYNWFDINNNEDSLAYFGVYERIPTPDVLGYWEWTENAYIPQKGIAKNSGFFGITYTDTYVINPFNRFYYSYFNTWFYKLDACLFPKTFIVWDSSIYPPVDAKKSFALGMFPIDRSLGEVYLTNNGTAVQRYDFYNQQAYSKIENWVNLYKYIVDNPTGSLWNMTTQHQQDFQKFWLKYDTLAKFAKCRNPAIKDIAEFMCYCFIDGNQGVFGTYTNFFDPLAEQHIVHPLYTIECVQKKAQYWYKFFKKRKMPLWEYLRYTV